MKRFEKLYSAFEQKMTSCPTSDKAHSTNKRNPLTKSYSCSSPNRPSPVGNFALITAEEFVELISDDSNSLDVSNVPILDCRSQIDFGCERIRSSHNINCRAKIVARKLASKRLDELEPNLSLSLNNSDKVILYDQSSDGRTAERIESSPINLVVRAAQKSNKKVHIIQGGIEAVKTAFPHLIEYQPNDVNEKIEGAAPSSPLAAEKENVRMTKILPQIFVGNVFDAQNLERLTENKISHILNSTADLPFFWEEKFQYFRVPAFDRPSQNIRQYFPDAVDFLEKALENEENNVLVHCSAGISRSPTLVLAFMIKSQRMTFDEAFEKIRHCRPIVDPNVSFLIQLRDWEKSLAKLTDESNLPDPTISVD